ncbi:MAG: OmpA family protein [Pontixanthobacter sp.]
MSVRPIIAICVGVLVTVALGFAGAAYNAGAMATALDRQARMVLAQANVPAIEATFATADGWPSRHPVLSGGGDMDEAQRANAARAVASIPGVGGIRWIDGSMVAAQGSQMAQPLTPLHCQDDVEALLRARTIRFEESSSAIDIASGELLDEVADALRPCLGSIIAITGHTDKSGPEPGNIALSRERALAVRLALQQRGIPRDGLRASGVGSSDPVNGLAPGDPANRRIEFSVIATEPILPTPVDTPGAR